MIPPFTRWAAIAAVLALPLLPAKADFAAGWAAYEAGDFATAATEWGAMAEAGDRESQYQLGRLYFSGKGVARDLKRAESLFREAAVNGHAGAQFALAVLLARDGQDSEAVAEATQWYRAAAEQGHARAQYLLGLTFYDLQTNEFTDRVQAAFWLHRAASQGVREAAFMAAIAYTTLDPGRAWVWANIALDGGTREAEGLIAHLETLLTNKDIQELIPVYDAISATLSRAGG